MRHETEFQRNPRPLWKPQVLKTEPKDALLVVHRVTYWQNRPVSIDHVRIIGSKYEVEISGKGRSK